MACTILNKRSLEREQREYTQMKSITKIYRRKWFLLFGFVIVIKLLLELGYYYLESFQIVPKLLLDITILVGIMAIPIFMQRDMHKTNIELQANKQKLKNIFDTLDVAVWSHDLQTDHLLITSGIQKLYDYSLNEFYEDKLLWKKVIHPEDLSIINEREKLLATGESVISIYRIQRKDGEVRWIQDRGIPTLDKNGHFIDFTSVLFDITDRKESEERYRSLVEMSPDMIAVVSKGKIDYANGAGCEFAGITTPQELIGQPLENIFPEEVLNELRIIEENSNSGVCKSFEFQLTAPDGIKRDLEMSAVPTLYEGRLAKQIIVHDITDQKRAKQTIEFMAYYDALTGLPNRYMFRKYLNDMLNNSEEQALAVLFLDLDRFKVINDTKGHSIGDQLLKKVANRLQRRVQHVGMVSRLGGDEFIILLEDTDRIKTKDLARQLINEFSPPLELNGQEYFITPSIGISMYPEDGEDEETLIRQADTAMYLAKDRGKNNFQFYHPQLNSLSLRKMELETALRKAIEQESFTIHYQPQVDLKTGMIVGVEALLRWVHPTHGFISPGEFIPLAEETGLIVPLGKWVLQEACRQNKQWRDAGLSDIPVSINISVRQMQEEDFIECVERVVQELGVIPSCVELEITESIIQNIDESLLILNQLKELGFKLSIDDFGTGYSSLSYLKHLPIDKIKIDKSFVDDIVEDSSGGAIVKTIIDMGTNLNFTVIAEGIETEDQQQFLIQNGCELGQGYLFSRPLPLQEVKELLRQGIVHNKIIQ